MPLAYYLILITPNLTVNLEAFLSLWNGGALVKSLPCFADAAMLMKVCGRETHVRMLAWLYACMPG